MESLNCYMLIFAFLSGLIIQTHGAPEYCPDAAKIAPCQCYAFSNYDITMDCSQVTHEDELIQAFQADFPYTQMKLLKIKRNQELREITSNFLGLTTFQEIYFHHCELSVIASAFFDNLKNSLTDLRIYDCKLTDSGFDLTVINDLVNINNVELHDNELKTLPVLSSSTLFQLHLANNSISYIADNAFTQATALFYLFLYGNDIQNIPNGKFQNTKIHY